jgi:hypothetical protein
MRVVNVAEDLKRKMTQSEVDAKLAWLQDWGKRVDEAARTDPLPDDIMDYCEGKKWRLADGTVVTAASQGAK